MSRYYLPEYVDVDGVQHARCRRCKQLKLPTPDNFADDKRVPWYRPRTICIECRDKEWTLYTKKAGKYLSRPGYIYFMELLQGTKHYPTGTIKIGFSANIPQRMRSLAGGYRAVRCIARIKGVFDDERKVHERFEHLRIEREYFRPEDELMQFIKENAERYVYKVDYRNGEGKSA